MEMQNDACGDPYQGINCDESRYSKDTIVWYAIEKLGLAESLKTRDREAWHCESDIKVVIQTMVLSSPRNNHRQRITETTMREHKEESVNRRKRADIFSPPQTF
jgi:hypothetical protein